MLLNNGVYGGQRILSRPTIQTMTTNQVTAEQAEKSFLEHGGWGFGMQVAVRA